MANEPTLRQNLAKLESFQNLPSDWFHSDAGHNAPVPSYYAITQAKEICQVLHDEPLSVIDCSPDALGGIVLHVVLAGDERALRETERSVDVEIRNQGNVILLYKDYVTKVTAIEAMYCPAFNPPYDILWKDIIVSFLYKGFSR